MVSSTASAVYESLRWAQGELGVHADPGHHRRASLHDDISRMSTRMLELRLFTIVPQRRTTGMVVRSVHPHAGVDVFDAEYMVQTELMRLEHVISPRRLAVYKRPGETARQTVHRLFASAKREQRAAAAAST